MKPIGGYFELELRKGKEYHQGAIRLNTGRNAFEYILRAKEYQKVYLPYFTCDVMLEPIQKLKLELEFYHINEQMEPVFNFSRIGRNETFVYTNYFGLKSQIVRQLSEKCRNLIIDNSQAFFEKPIDGIDTFYSPRKFFGLPDGAYLFTDKKLNKELTINKSANRLSHLIKRIEGEAETGYEDFKMNDNSLIGQSINKMSLLTLALLCNIDYEYIKKKRIENFLYLHKQLSEYNELSLKLDVNSVPMIYPFLKKETGLKQKLIDNKIYIATYWPNVFKWCLENELEYSMAKQIVPLPIDQRYGLEEMKSIINLIIK